MAGGKLNLDKTGLEHTLHGTWDFPVSGGEHAGRIEHFEGGRFECHFHPAVEITLILEGEMYYQANDTVYLLHSGDGIFVNAGVIHAGWQSGEKTCAYLPFDFAPMMVYGYEECRIKGKYVDPLTQGGLPALALFAHEPAHAAALSAMREIMVLKKEAQTGYELLLKAALCRLWYHLWHIAVALPRPAPPAGAECVKKVLLYMEQHFAESVTLADLARASGLSRGEVCRVFRRYTGRTPFSYLTHLRVRRSLPLLTDNTLRVSDIAARCGFSGGAYYAEMFRRYFGCAPLDYRKKVKETENA